MITSLLLAVAVGQTPSPLFMPDHGFVQNMGQWDAQAKFLTRASNLDMWIGDREIVYDFHKIYSVDQGQTRLPNGKLRDQKIEGQVVRMRFLGGSPKARVYGEGAQSSAINYMIGNDRSKWVRSATSFANIHVEGLYPGIDALHYLDKGRPRYDLVVQPRADVSQIKISFLGTGAVGVNANGELTFPTRFGEVTQGELKTYQRIGGSQVTVPSSFRQNADGTFGFEIGTYDSSKPLVIDPVLWGNFIGSTGPEQALDVTSDGVGNSYVTGYTSSPNFIIKQGSYDTTFNGVKDVFVNKFDPSGALIYATFVSGTAGSNNDEYGTSIAVDSGGDAYVTGFTNSSDFPTSATAFDKTYNGQGDAFVIRLNPTGTALDFSTFLGGSEGAGASGEDYGTGINVDGIGNAYVTGVTTSSNFPTTVGAYDTSYNGLADVFVTKLNLAGSALTYSTYLGSSANDYSRAIGIDSNGRAYVGGGTFSVEFPTTLGAFDRDHNGDEDCFVTKLDPFGASLIYSTFVGGAGADYVSGVKVDSSNLCYVVGSTSSADFPTTGGAYDRTYNGQSDAFYFRLNGQGAGLQTSTYFGGTGFDSAMDLSLDSGGRPTIVGNTYSADFPTTVGATNTTYGGLGDGFIAKFDRGAASLYYSSYIGGSDLDEAAAIASDYGNIRFVVGSTRSTNFNVGQGAVPTAGTQYSLLSVPAVNSIVVAAGNFTAGGFPEVLVANSATGSLQVWSIAGRTTTLVQTLTSTLAASEVVKAMADFDGDGKADLLIQNTITLDLAIWTFDGITRTSVLAVSHVPTAAQFVVPGTADFNSDGKPDILIQNGNTLVAWIMNVNNRTATATLSAAVAAGFTARSVTNRALGATIVVQRTVAPTLGIVRLMKTDRTTVLSDTPLALTNPNAGATNVVVAMADMSGDGAMDLIFESSTSRVIGVRTMNWGIEYDSYNSGFPTDVYQAFLMKYRVLGNPTIVFQEGQAITNWGMDLATQTDTKIVISIPAGFSCRGTADFNLDGYADLVVQNDVTREIAIWTMRNLVNLDVFPVPFIPAANRAIVAVGDLTGDGYPEILLRNTANSQLQAMRFIGTGLQSVNAITPNPAATLQAVAIADFDQDGKNDILFFDTASRQFVVWYMNGLTQSSIGVVSASVPVGSTFRGVGNFNFDQKPDILIQDDTSRQMTIWLMDNVTQTSTVSVPTIPIATSIIRGILN